MASLVSQEELNSLIDDFRNETEESCSEDNKCIKCQIRDIMLYNRQIHTLIFYALSPPSLESLVNLFALAFLLGQTHGRKEAELEQLELLAKK